MKKFSKTFEKTITLCRFFSLGIVITKVFCIAIVSMRSVEHQHLNSHFFQDFHSFGIFLCKVCQPYRFQNSYSFGIFSAKPANSTFVRIPILLVTEIFLCEAYQFQKTSQTSGAQKNTPLLLQCGLQKYTFQVASFRIEGTISLSRLAKVLKLVSICNLHPGTKALCWRLLVSTSSC